MYARPPVEVPPDRTGDRGPDQPDRCQGDVVRLFSQINSKDPEKRKLYFKNEKFRQAWLDSVNKNLAYWDSIIDKMKE